MRSLQGDDMVTIEGRRESDDHVPNIFTMEGKMREKSSPPTKMQAEVREHTGSI
jgi:hypothetical protein